MNQKQLLLVLLCASFAPIFQYAGDKSVIIILLILSCDLMLNYIQQKQVAILGGKIYSGIYVLLLTFLIINYGQISAKSWEMTLKAVPVILLLLSYLSSANIGKLAGVLIWVEVLLLSIVLLSGIKDMEYNRISIQLDNTAWELLPIILLPVNGITKEKRQKYILIEISLLVMASIWIQGNSPILGEERSIAFAGKNISGIGSLTKLDGIISIMMTISWFVLLSYLQKELKKFVPQKFHHSIELIIVINILFNVEINWIIINTIMIVCVILSRIGKNTLTT